MARRAVCCATRSVSTKSSSVPGSILGDTTSAKTLNRSELRTQKFRCQKLQSDGGSPNGARLSSIGRRAVALRSSRRYAVLHGMDGQQVVRNGGFVAARATWKGFLKISLVNIP